jgi:hypothetical protein
MYRLITIAILDRLLHTATASRSQKRAIAYEKSVSPV